MSRIMEDRRNRRARVNGCAVVPSGWNHRSNWPRILNRVMEDKLWAALGEGRPANGNAARAGWTPRLLLFLSVCIGWSGKRQLTERFAEARIVAGQLYRGPLTNRIVKGGPDEMPRSYQGFFKQLRRSGVPFMRSAVHTLRQQGPRFAGRRWYQHNWILFAADGSRLEAPRTVSNEDGLGRGGSERSAPQAWVTMLAHLPTGLMWDWRQGPGSASERHHLLEMVATLPERALLIADAGFVGYELMRSLNDAGRRFLIRCGSNFTLLTETPVRRAMLLNSKPGIPVWLWPMEHLLKEQPPLKLRLIVLKRKKRPIYLVTNVASSTELPKRLAGEFYEARWGIELTYRHLKQTMERRKLLARTAAHAQMELAANLLALFVLVLHGLLILGRRADRLSVAAALRVLRTAIEALRWGVAWLEFLTEFRCATRDDYTRHRPKAARHWPRHKTESPPGPPNLRTMIPAERSLLRLIKLEGTKTG
jgi:hypothetical protein